MSIIVDSNGEYLRDQDDRLRTSDYSAHRARVELGLQKGSWLHAPSRGHDLKKYNTVKKTPVEQEDFEKHVTGYLKKYSPDVVSRLYDRSQFNLKLDINEDNING